MKWAAVGVFVVTTMVMFAYAVQLPRMAAARDSPARRRHLRRLLRWVGLWELSVSLVLFSAQGWSAVPSMIAMIAVGVVVAFLPQIFAE